ncbi:MAG: hypothetical protein CVT49_06170 [candidate division Zixibacteria bacterium HGW-Zixibacteria-1]|nr:MAG: hypothetical protein CVT49_06170 [candidate division Zixibacteria bacterium HGW-Zixibacteria-1]
MKMPILTIIYAVALILLGVIGFGVTGAASVTALIPAYFGAVVLIFGLLAFRDKYRKRAMHAVSLLSLIGFIATISGPAKMFTLLSGGEVARPAAVISQSIMAVLSLLFFLLCLKSFIDARGGAAGPGGKTS